MTEQISEALLTKMQQMGIDTRKIKLQADKTKDP